MINPWIILAVVAAFIANGFYWFDAGQTQSNLEWTAKMNAVNAEAQEQARVIEHQWQEAINESEKKHLHDLDNVRSKLRAAVASLSARPARREYLPGDTATPGQCDGATGADLSRQDGEFLAGEAARCDEITIQLGAAQGYIKAIRP